MQRIVLKKKILFFGYCFYDYLFDLKDGSTIENQSGSENFLIFLIY